MVRTAATESTMVRSGEVAALIALVSLFASPTARAESSLTLGFSALQDNQRYESQQYRAEWRRETPTSGQWVAARFYQYAL
ncbi:MAG TPA: hypothetical protein VNO55_31890, partial [Polyangia bacterium]|nr:hypothetical protein [Polyangia bacterium]